MKKIAFVILMAAALLVATASPALAGGG